MAAEGSGLEEEGCLRAAAGGFAILHPPAPMWFERGFVPGESLMLRREEPDSGVPEARPIRERQVTLARDARDLNVGMQERRPLFGPSSIPDAGSSLRTFLCGNPPGGGDFPETGHSERPYCGFCRR